MTARGRRDQASRALIQEFRVLKERGCSAAEAVRRSEQCSSSYRFRIFYLLEHGYPELIDEVEQGLVPLTVAVQIGRARNMDLQKVLCAGFKAGTVSMAQITTIQQIIDRHESEKPPLEHTEGNRSDAARALVRHFRAEADKQKFTTEKTRLVRLHLTFIMGALHKLLAAPPFVALLRDEGLGTMPNWLAESTNHGAKDS